MSVITVDTRTIARRYAPHAGMALPGMEFVLHHCYEAHRQAIEDGRDSNDLTIEVGSFRGQTALAILDLLQNTYTHRPPPMLFTVDPYGSKPYESGDSSGAIDYGDDIYTSQKQRLAPYPNHAHFLMRSTDFFYCVVGTPYWMRGQRKLVERFRFVLLDGEHSTDVVMEEVNHIKNFGLMASGGRVVIDNVDKDPTLIPKLLEEGYELGPPAPFGARQAYRVY